jgi:hypothetical protein
MGRMRVDYYHVRTSEVGSPCLSQLRTDRLASVSKFNYVLMQTRFMDSCKLSSFEGRRVERYPTIPLGCTSG